MDHCDRPAYLIPPLNRASARFFLPIIHASVNAAPFKFPGGGACSVRLFVQPVPNLLEHRGGPAADDHQDTLIAVKSARLVGQRQRCTAGWLDQQSVIAQEILAGLQRGTVGDLFTEHGMLLCTREHLIGHPFGPQRGRYRTERCQGPPATMAACSDAAPSVSTASTGTSCQPLRCKPSTTPLSSPPPPTDSTTASGFTPLWATSSIMLA